MRRVEPVLVCFILAMISLPNLIQSYAVESCEGLAKVGDRVGIKYQLTVNQTAKQPYATIVQIKDSDGFTVLLSWLVGKFEAGQAMQIIQSWVPESTGQYNAEVFVWTSIDSPQALSPTKTLTIDVNC